MATYLYSTNDTDGTPNTRTIAFTTGDYFNYDDETVTAASLSISGAATAEIAGVKTYELTSFGLKKISSTNFLFADGSKLQIGDGVTGTTNDDLANIIIGTDYDDYFDGLLGSDTISYASAASGVTINLTAGTTAGGAGVDKLLNIENAIGSAFSDTLIAGSTGSRLDGGAGIDTLTGGAGNDTFVVTAGDTVSDSSSSDTDTVSSSADYTLPSNVENLTLTGSAIQGVGNSVANTITGNTGNNILDGGAGNDILIGGAGNDTYLVDSTSDTVTEAASAGTDIVYSTATFTLGTNVENLRLMGTSAINGTGNTSNNIIYANSGNNTLNGLGGTDTLSYQYGATSGVTVSLDTTEEQDTANGSTVLGASGTDMISNFENLTGSRYSDSLTGTSGNNELIGGGGNDTLTGLGGTDTLDGGNGNDTYVVTTTTGITFKDSAGIDTLQSSGVASIESFSYLENLTLTGSANINGTGNGGNNALIGNSGDNTLVGGLGNDVLQGGGGTDTFEGGAGNDTYLIVSVSSETINETSGSGTDLVISDVTGLILDVNVENLTIGTATIGATGTLSAITVGTTGVAATGNTSNNIMTGGTGADTLNGGVGNDTLIGGLGNDSLNGGNGADSMNGGAGNDTYVVDSSTDKAIEVIGSGATEILKASANGTDTVQSSIAYTLGSYIENLTLTGSSAVNGSGNTLNNFITGNSGANTLIGSSGNDTLNGGGGDDILNGGAGIDSMNGGAGNDTYYVDSASDDVVEGTSEGTDIVLASVTYSMSDADVENLTLTGSSAINGTGNTGANILTGNDANNTLVGNGGGDTFIGGGGKDTLTGNTGVDTFIYNAVTESSPINFDVINNFTSGTDKIDVSAIFDGITAPTAFVSSFTGLGDAQIIFSSSKITFDVNGDSNADFAISLTGVTTLAADLSDFIFV